MYAPQRHRRILDDVERSGRVTVSDLADQFGVATETIRRDLDDLDRRRLLMRVHGGAVARRTTVVEPSLEDRRTTNTALKERIARAAAELLPTDPEAAIQLDAGTTMLALVPYLGDRSGPVVTHAVDVAQAALSHSGPPVHLLPGRLRPGTGAAVGAVTVDAVRRLRPELALLGCNGFDAQSLYTPDPSEAAVKHAIVEQASRRVLLADSTKAGSVHLVSFASTSGIDTLVTDEGLPPSLRRTLAEAGVEVVLA